MKALLRLAKKILENVLQQLTQQFNVVQEMAMAPVRAIVQAVIGGVWKGDGATAFVEELNSLAIPSIGRIGDSITSKIEKLNTSRDILERADSEVRNMVGQLEDVLNFY